MQQDANSNHPDPGQGENRINQITRRANMEFGMPQGAMGMTPAGQHLMSGVPGVAAMMGQWPVHGEFRMPYRHQAMGMTTAHHLMTGPGGPEGAMAGRWPGQAMVQHGGQIGSGMNQNMMPGEVSIHNNLILGQRPGYEQSMMQPVHQNLMMYGSGIGMLTTPDQDLHIFIEACKVNNVIKAKMALDLGVDVNAVSKDGHWAGITAAAYHNSKDIMEMLLSHPKIDVNVTTTGGFTPLMGIAKVEFSPLIWACCDGGKFDVLEQLIKVPELNFNYVGTCGKTWGAAVHLVARHNFLKCAKVLAKASQVDWNNKNKGGECPLTVSIVKGHLETFNFILSIPRVDINSQDIDGLTPLHCALYEANQEMVCILLARDDIDLSVKTKRGDGFVEAAVYGGSEDCVKLLARVDADGLEWNKSSSICNTPLLTALMLNNLEVVEALMENPRVDRNVRDISGKSFEQLAKEKKFIVETNEQESPGTYSSLRAKVLGSIPDGFNFNDIMSKCLELVEGKSILRRRNIAKINTFEDFLVEMENRMIIFDGQKKLQNFARLVKFLHEQHPDVVSLELYREVQDYSDIHDPSDRYTVYFENGRERGPLGLGYSVSLNIPNTEPVTVSKIVKGSRAEKYGVIKKGHIILSINDTSVDGLSLRQVKNLLDHHNQDYLKVELLRTEPKPEEPSTYEPLDVRVRRFEQALNRKMQHP